jgi:hypothetical protein
MRLEYFNAFESTRDENAFKYTLSETEQRLRVLERSVGLLIARTKIGEFWADGFSDVARFLKSLPLATSEFHSARRHLQNALGYCQLKESGAATFELRVVRGILQRL